MMLHNTCTSVFLNYALITIVGLKKLNIIVNSYKRDFKINDYYYIILILQCYTKQNNKGRYTFCSLDIEHKVDNNNNRVII